MICVACSAIWLRIEFIVKLLSMLMWADIDWFVQRKKGVFYSYFKQHTFSMLNSQFDTRISRQMLLQVWFLPCNSIDYRLHKQYNVLDFISQLVCECIIARSFRSSKCHSTLQKDAVKDPWNLSSQNNQDVMLWHVVWFTYELTAD